jgi:hypothetical protein
MTAATGSSFIEARDYVAHRCEAIIGSREKKACFAIHSILITEGDSRMRDLKKAVCCIGQAA